MTEGILRLRRPTAADLAAMAERLRSGPLTYDAVGATISGAPPDGFHHVAAQVVLGQGEDTFARAKRALADWQHQRGAGLVIGAGAEVVEDAVVALAAPLPIGWVIVVCRVLAVIDEPSRFGFAYGTLAEHPESGEELFMVEIDADQGVTFRIEAFSKPQHPLAKFGSPVARRMQARATRRYLAAMRDAVDTGA